jgi:hypothetical protein
MVRAVRHFAPLVSLLLSSSLLAACGGAGEQPKTPSRNRPAARHDGGTDMSTSSEIGGMNQEASEAAFQAAASDLQRCFLKGAKHFEMLAGDVAIVVEVDQTGSLVRAYLERSDLGNRETEECMLAALKRQKWPATVGGRIGQARSSIGFDPAEPDTTRPAVQWSEDDVRPALEELSASLGACPGSGRGDYQLTWYVDTAGKVLSAGFATPQGADPAGAACLLSVIEEATFPSPGSWPAKVSVEL